MYLADFTQLMEGIAAQAVANTLFEAGGGDLNTTLQPEPSESDRAIASDVVLRLVGWLNLRVEESHDGFIDPGLPTFRIASKWLADEDLQKDTQ